MKVDIGPGIEGIRIMLELEDRPSDPVLESQTPWPERDGPSPQAVGHLITQIVGEPAFHGRLDRTNSDPPDTGELEMIAIRCVYLLHKVDPVGLLDPPIALEHPGQ